MTSGYASSTVIPSSRAIWGVVLGSPRSSKMRCSISVLSFVIGFHPNTLSGQWLKFIWASNQLSKHPDLGIDSPQSVARISKAVLGHSGFRVPHTAARDLDRQMATECLPRHDENQ